MPTVRVSPTDNREGRISKDEYVTYGTTACSAKYTLIPSFELEHTHKTSVIGDVNTHRYYVASFDTSFLEGKELLSAKVVFYPWRGDGYSRGVEYRAGKITVPPHDTEDVIDEAEFDLWGGATVLGQQDTLDFSADSGNPSAIEVSVPTTLIDQNGWSSFWIIGLPSNTDFPNSCENVYVYTEESGFKPYLEVEFYGEGFEWLSHHRAV